MKRAARPDEPEQGDDQAEEEVGEEGSERGGRAAAALVVAVLAWRLIVTYPYLAYTLVGVIGTLGCQRAAGWRAGRHKPDAEGEQAAEPQDVVAALHHLIGDDKGVLLTVLRDHLQLPDTKAVKALLEAEGIEWKASRTRKGNGPAVRREAIPATPSPVADEAHGERCCCRSGDNDNGNNSDREGAGKGIRVERTEGGLIIYDDTDPHRHHDISPS
ncbi:hypothetical protein ABT272_28180 [Streptomyces sp900105245]|uniref:Uncharacterized protein n=1 Tax=Streptomyces sp. 900105245 TaxID=3154379 RepID=A0ABV1UCZ4_9ACTN